MPMHWDCDWDWHYDHYWTPRLWFWDNFYHVKCPTRHRYWGFGASDFDVCARDWHMHQLNGKGTFKVIIDVHHFRMEELNVKVKNSDTLMLEGKQNDKRSEKTPFCMTREFTRKYKLPRNYDATLAKATLSKDGILSIMVPAPEPLDDVERIVDIIETGTYFGSTNATSDNDKAIEDAKPVENIDDAEKEEKQNSDK